MTEQKAVKLLSRKKDLEIQNKTILVLDGEGKKRVNDLGIGSWGKIDFLVNKKGYNQIFVSEF